MKKVMLFTMALLIASTAIFASGYVEVNRITNPKTGHCTVCSSNLMLSKKEEMKMEVMKIYSCPNHPDQFSSKPKNCPRCNKKMVGNKVHDHEKK